MSEVWPPAAQTLVQALCKLPSVGRRSAIRLTHHLLRCPETTASTLAHAILEARARIAPCAECGHHAQDGICPLCTDTRRDPTRLCVVEKPSDLVPLEAAGTWKGLYHVLGGLLSPLDGVGPAQLRLEELCARCARIGVQEVVLATPASTEGETTALWIARALAPAGVSITRLARGLPVGGEIEYSDVLTLHQAFEGRVPL